jgi:3-deoxy-D-manno-octulosonate 8-phosphate phosphatase (KDO 8-P phosphatase)
MTDPQVYERALPIRLVIFDVDGVLTDGGLFFDDLGREFKVFHSRDGHGMKMLQRSGVEIAVISGRETPAVAKRMAGLDIDLVYQGRQDKLPVFQTMMATKALSAEQIAYVGDDVVDLPVMGRAGLAVAVADAHPLVKRHAHWLTPNPGGRGAARDVCDLIMQAQGTLDAQLAEYVAGIE